MLKTFPGMLLAYLELKLRQGKTLEEELLLEDIDQEYHWTYIYIYSNSRTKKHFTDLMLLFKQTQYGEHSNEGLKKLITARPTACPRDAIAWGFQKKLFFFATCLHSLSRRQTRRRNAQKEADQYSHQNNGKKLNPDFLRSLEQKSMSPRFPSSLSGPSIQQALPV